MHDKVILSHFGVFKYDRDIISSGALQNRMPKCPIRSCLGEELMREVVSRQTQDRPHNHNFLTALPGRS